jgi:hypothetical protein
LVLHITPTRHHPNIPEETNLLPGITEKFIKQQKFQETPLGVKRWLLK